ncbi:hypothetical protein HMPREF0525_01145 [Lactobacillus jensenii 27-2-CHN]|nr:hypothetical protein HMPREF0525_01145 [Lactobacillus jensenii 27-2-CHN]
MWHLNSPKSVQGNLIRYTVYIVGYLMVVGAKELCANSSPLHIWDLILFAIVTIMTLLLFVYRFKREQRYFERVNKVNLLDNIKVTLFLSFFVFFLRGLISYLQVIHYLNSYTFQLTYAKHESVSMFWFLILSQGLVLPFLQVFLAEGFMFNYLFRDNVGSVAIFGIVFSGLAFSFLNFQLNAPIFLLDMIFGVVFAWAYLYSQNIVMPLYLAILNGLLMVILI